MGSCCCFHRVKHKGQILDSSRASPVHAQRRPLQINRDTLPPLLPVYTRHYLVLAPHDMCYEDLEVRCLVTVLEQLNYCLTVFSASST